MAQVSKDAYSFVSYVPPERWASYYYQLREIVASAPKTVLEVGVGDGVVRDYLRGACMMNYTSVDLAADLLPDVVGSVEALPFPDGTFDLVSACEVLEHLPFERFDKALAELARVSSRSVLVSLPHFGPPIRLSIKVPFLPEARIFFKLPFPRQHLFNGQHYWEIGKRGYSVGTVRSHIERYFWIVREYVPFEAPYHRFYSLIKRG